MGELLSVLTGQRDVAFGITVSGRPAELAGAESMVGLFINTVPVRAVLTATTTTAQLLRQLQTAHNDTVEHQHLPLSDIHRVTGHDALFDTLFVYENYPLDTSTPLADPELAITAVSGREFNHYPLTLQVLPGPRLRLRVEYATEVFDAASITVLIERLERVLASMTADPARVLSSVDVLDEREHTHLDTVGHRAALTEPPTKPVSIPELFAAQVARTPDAVALVCGERLWSYRELDEAANRLAHLLAAHGVGPGDVVALLLPRSPEAITAIVAVLKTGAAYLPLDPQHPQPRIGLLLDDAAPIAAITTAELAGRLDGCHVVVIDVTDPGIDTQPSTARAAPSPDGIAYLMYTSGSTGVPKGVAVTHAGIADLVGTCVERLAITPESRILQFAPLVFDVSVGNMWCALLTGAAAVIPEADQELPGEELVDLIVRQKISHADFTPSALATLPPDRLQGVALVVAGEACPTELVDRYAAVGTTVVNAYGPTETTVYASMSAPLVAGSGTAPIGSPVSGAGVVCAGWVVASGAGGGGGGVVCGRCGGGVWVLASGGVDRVAVCGVPVRGGWGAGNTDVSHRGFGALAH